MEFRWEQVNEYLLILFGYENSKIATVEWNNDIEIWELSSEWLDHSSDIDEEIGLEDIELVKKDALEQLMETCNEHMDWYKGQREMIEELFQDICCK